MKFKQSFSAALLAAATLFVLAISHRTSAKSPEFTTPPTEIAAMGLPISRSPQGTRS